MFLDSLQQRCFNRLRIIAPYSALTRQSLRQRFQPEWSRRRCDAELRKPECGAAGKCGIGDRVEAGVLRLSSRRRRYREAL
jgi:hypothetical protein